MQRSGSNSTLTTSLAIEVPMIADSMKATATYQLLSLRLWNVMHKALGRVISCKVVEVVKEGFSLD